MEATLCRALGVSGWAPGDLRTVEGSPPAFLGVTFGSHAFWKARETLRVHPKAPGFPTGIARVERDLEPTGRPKVPTRASSVRPTKAYPLL